MKNKNRGNSLETSSQIGFTTFSERFNGRLAMISFTIILLIEVLSKQKLESLVFGL